MDSLHRQYLDEMGIAVFSLRPEKLEVASETMVESFESRSTIDSPVDSPLESAPTPLGESAESARQMLKKQLNVGMSADTIAKKAIKNVDKKELLKKVVTVSESPNFFFCFLDYEDISLMLSLDIGADSLPTDARQLCDDIVFALSRERKIPKIRDLRWPLVSAAHIQQTSDDARMILGEMIKQSQENLILFGSDTAEYRAEKTQGTYLVVKSIEHYLRTPTAKAELWQQLLPLIKAL